MNMTDSKQMKTISCPTCEKPSVFAPSNPFRPFCCERCKLIDLGAWASEDYKIPTKEPINEWEMNEKEG